METTDPIIRCWRCGESLAALSLPFSRRDECPSCTAHLHVCRMCEFFDTAAVNQCREDDAEEVKEKAKVNFCEWFKPGTEAFDPQRAMEARKAESALGALFGESSAESPDEDEQRKRAEDLFR